MASLRPIFTPLEPPRWRAAQPICDPPAGPRGELCGLFMAVGTTPVASWIGPWRAQIGTPYRLAYFHPKIHAGSAEENFDLCHFHVLLHRFRLRSEITFIFHVLKTKNTQNTHIPLSKTAAVHFVRECRPLQPRAAVHEYRVQNTDQQTRRRGSKRE